MTLKAFTRRSQDKKRREKSSQESEYISERRMGRGRGGERLKRLPRAGELCKRGTD